MTKNNDKNYGKFGIRVYLSKIRFVMRERIWSFSENCVTDGVRLEFIGCQKILVEILVIQGYFANLST